MTEQDIEREVGRYMDLPYRVELTPDGDGWFVRVPDLPYCMSQGDTIEEAMAMIRDAQRGWLTVRLAKGLSIPGPTTPSYSDDEHTGAFGSSVRVPQTVQHALSQAAERTGITVDAYVGAILAHAVDHESSLVSEASSIRKKRIDVA